MIKSFMLLFIAASFSLPAIAADGFKLIHVADLDKSMQTQKDNVFIFDANSDSTREKEGMIPGAKPLASATQYDAKATLPSDKKSSLVFYCGNTACTASHEAAKVAVKSGYTNVSVMADGISGWVKAGKKTVKFTKGI